MTNLSLCLTESAARYPDAAALRCDGATTTYSSLALDVARFADYLIDSGLEPGDRVGIMLRDRPEFAVVFYAVLHAGGVAVPMNPSLSARAVEFHVTITGARLLFFSGRRPLATTIAALTAGTQPVRVGKRGIARLTAGFAGRAEPVSRAEGDAAVILHTPGTTGVPAGAQLTQGDLASNQAVVARSLLGLGADDVVMGCLPLFEPFGMTCGLLASISTGATLLLVPRFDSRRALEMIATEQVTVFDGVPSMFTSMLTAAEHSGLDFSSLRTCIAAGAAMPADVHRRFENRFGCTVWEEYGLSETLPVACLTHPGGARKVGSLGRPIDGVEMRVVDDKGCEVPVGVAGEIQIRGRNVMKGYSNLPEATEPDLSEGWLATGDTGRVDVDGHFFLVDSKKT